MSATSAQLTRYVQRLKREPFTTFFSLTQPVIWLLFYANLMKNASFRGNEVDHYPTFMLAGIISFTVFSNSLGGGIPLLFDKENGFLARLLSTPIPRSSIILSRFINILIVSVVQVLIIVGLSALILRTSIATGVPGFLMILVVSTLLGFGLTVLSLVMAFTLSGHAAFFSLLSFISLPALFLSPALVPLDVMPTWMQWLSYLNPMTHAVQAMRELIVTGWNPAQLGTSIGILVVIDILCLFLGIRVLSRHLKT